MTTFSCRLLIVLGIVLSVNCFAYAQKSACPAVQSERAEQEAETLRTWDALYKSYVAFSKCDDGSIGEGYSESVARILIDHWNTLPRLSYFIEKDPAFRRFVLRHVDATLDTLDLKKLNNLASTKCPAGLVSLCNELKKQSNSALKENASIN